MWQTALCSEVLDHWHVKLQCSKHKSEYMQGLWTPGVEKTGLKTYDI